MEVGATPPLAYTIPDIIIYLEGNLVVTPGFLRNFPKFHTGFSFLNPSQQNLKFQRVLHEFDS